MHAGLQQHFADDREEDGSRRRAYALSIAKCLSAPYLARSFCSEQAIACFIHHHRFMMDTVPFARLRKLADEDYVLWRRGELAITVKLEHVILNEGEITLHFKDGPHPLYGLSFSFVSGAIVAAPDATVALISRMQGRRGEAARISQATKACGDISPQSMLYSAFQGIMTALDIPRYYGVSAPNHVCHADRLADLLHRAYDEFYTSIGGCCFNGFYRLSARGSLKDLSLISPSHRRRTRKKREAKRGVIDVACRSWLELCERRSERGVSCLDAKPVPLFSSEAVGG